MVALSVPSIPGMRFVVPVVGSLANPAAVYARNGFTPKLVVDAITDTYISKSKVKTFAQMFDSAERDGLATMWGSDGTLKWCPHNTLIRSDVAYEGWNLSTADSYETGIVGPDGKPNAIRITDTDANGRVFLNNTVGYTGAVRGIWARSPEGNVSIRFFDTNSLNTFDITSEWAYYESDEGSFGGQNFYIADFRVGTATVVEVAYPREYMGGLGGMAPVPEDERVWDGDPYYLPTDGAARYLMRRGHHVYNSVEGWTLEGVLREDAEATNLVPYSTPADGDWTTSKIAISEGSGMLGMPSAIISSDDDTGKSYISVAVATGDETCASLIVKPGTADTLQWRFGKNGNYVAVDVDLSAGTLGTPEAGGTGVVSSSGILSIGGGIYLVYLSGTGIGNGTLCDAQVIPGIYDGPVTALDTVEVCHVQVEAGTLPSMPIPTSGAEVSRTADPDLSLLPALLPVSGGMPAKVALCFKGEINYADLDQYTQGSIFEWGASLTNQLKVRLNTNTSDYLQAYGRVDGGSVFYEAGEMKEFQEGLNRDVSMASVYGVGYVRSGHDGAANTVTGANPAIPAVEDDSVYLLKTVDGILGQFLLWDEDIGEAGIIEASALEEAA